MSTRPLLASFAVVVLFAVSACSSSVVVGPPPLGSEPASTSLPSEAPVVDIDQVAPTPEPTSERLTEEIATQAEPTPTAVPADTGAGVVTGVVDLPVAGVLETELDPAAFFSPEMQARLDQLVRPDSLVEPRPEHATLIGGMRKVEGDTFEDTPWVAASDVRFFTFAHEVDPTASLDVITPSYFEFTERVNGVDVSIGPRNGGPNWIIEPAGQTPAERLARRGLPHLLSVDTILRGGSAYDIEQMLLTIFRFAHRRAVIGSPPVVADTMPEWVQQEAEMLGPLIEATGMRITAWTATVQVDWIPDEPPEARGESTVTITLGTAANSLAGDPGDGVFQVLNDLGGTIAAEGEFTGVFFQEETDNHFGPVDLGLLGGHRPLDKRNEGRESRQVGGIDLPRFGSRITLLRGQR